MACDDDGQRLIFVANPKMGRLSLKKSKAQHGSTSLHSCGARRDLALENGMHPKWDGLIAKPNIGTSGK